MKARKEVSIAGGFEAAPKGRIAQAVFEMRELSHREYIHFIKEGLECKKQGSL
jgi:hypothetical protein